MEIRTGSDTDQVFFYTDWCTHCKNAKPEFSAAADSLAADIRIQFAGVDCGPYKQLCNMYDVAGFPTILYFNYGKNEQKYLGDRSQDAFINFMNDPVRGLAEFAQENFQIHPRWITRRQKSVRLSKSNLKMKTRM